MNEVVLDTETTGLSVKEGHRIVEIGCIELKNQIPTGNTFHCYLNPQRKVSEDAYKIHGYSNEFLADKKTFTEISKIFLQFVKEKKLIVHNAAFDISFLNNELKLIKNEEINIKNVIDTLEIARLKFPGSSNSLDALCRRFRIDNSMREKHDAITDCELLVKVYINLIDQKEPKLDFNNQSINQQKDFNILEKNNDHSCKIIKISKQELDLHKKFLKKDLRKNFY